VYRGSFTDAKSQLSHYLSAATSIFHGRRSTSLSSLPGRRSRGSSVSVLSERRTSLTSYLAGRRSSDASITSDSSSDNTNDITAGHFVHKREFMFSPILEEESEFEVETTDQQENTAQKQSSQIKIISDHMSIKGSNMLDSELFLELLEEPTLPKLITYKSTAI